MKIFKLSTKSWYLERTVFLIGGLFILASIALAMTVSPNFYYFTAFVGLMQVIFALTGYCPMAILLNLLGVKER